jgi:predicted MPP superfamily phosphohydrolase
MKVLFIGDCHLKINQFQLGLQFLSWLDKLIAEEEPDLVVNLGDFFNDHAVLRSEVMTEFMKHVESVLRLKIPYLYLVGNHCQYRPKDSKYHALKHLVGKIPNFHVIDTPQDLFGMTFVPFQPNPASFPTKSLPICVAHQTFKGRRWSRCR